MRFFLCVVWFAGLGGCATRPLQPRNLSLLKAEIVAYVDSGLYVKEIEAVAEDAIRWIEHRAKSGEASGVQSSLMRLAVVFDIDETMLSNLPHMRAMDFGYLPEAWNAWIDRAEAPAIAPVLKIYHRCRELGVPVIFITGRRERDRLGTEKNLQAIGVSGGSTIFFKPDAAKENTEAFKTAIRAKLVSEGQVIIANIGDQESDLSGGSSERVFKLPAPFYLTR